MPIVKCADMPEALTNNVAGRKDTHFSVNEVLSRFFKSYSTYS